MDSRVSKHAKALATATVLATIGLVGLVPGHAWAATGESEPNDTFAQANAISPNCDYAGYNRDMYDYDCFRFTLNQPGKVNITHQHNVSQQGNWYIEIYNDAGERVFFNTLKGMPATVTSCNTGLAAGTYYLKISQYQIPVDGSYGFRVNFTPSNCWEAEPNDTLERAKTIALNTRYYGTGEGEYSRDTFKFNISKTTKVTLNFRHPIAERGSWELCLYDASGRQVSSNYVSGASSSFTTSAMSLSPGWYYVEVKCNLNVLGLDYNFCVSTNSGVSAGWKKSGGRWWYQYSNGSYPRNCWAQIGGKWYHFDGSGYMQTGWQPIGGKWYYLNSDGSMATGWKKVNGTWYYLKSSGAMATGWQKIGGKWYYFSSSGAMSANTWVGNYHVNSSGYWDRSR